NARLCLNGHEYAKRQLQKRAIAFEPLDNGILSCAEPENLQALCDGLTPAKIQRLWQKWAKRLPHPFPAKDRAAGFRYDLFLQQAEFARTQAGQVFQHLLWPALQLEPRGTSHPEGRLCPGSRAAYGGPTRPAFTSSSAAMTAI